MNIMADTKNFIHCQDMEPNLIPWKGASVLSCLDTTQELWIRQKEWQQWSVRILRERAPFIW